MYEDHTMGIMGWFLDRAPREWHRRLKAELGVKVFNEQNAVLLLFLEGESRQDVNMTHVNFIREYGSDCPILFSHLDRLERDGLMTKQTLRDGEIGRASCRERV
jgi:hypothetical protein